jgi:DNA repair protein RecN (Recombination protein N)
MLLTLKVSNYALIRSLRVDFSQGLNIITGETGAGKSILLGALGLLTGKRAESSAIQAAEKCVIEGEFQIPDELNFFFRQADLDFHNPCIVRRELLPGGKSRAFVNDTPVNLKVLQELSNYLIDIHSQHEVFSLADPAYLLSVTDTFSDSSADAASFLQKFESWQQLRQERDELRETIRTLQSESDYLMFRMAELDDAALQAGEEEELENELKLLANAEDVKSALYAAVQISESGDENIISLLTKLNQILQKVSNFHPQLPELTERVKSVTIELKDIASELVSISSGVEHNPSRLEWVGDRLALIQKLKKIHHVLTLDDLLDTAENIRTRLAGLQYSEEQLNRLTQKVKELEDELIDAAEKLHAKRVKGAEKLRGEVEKRLRRLNMPQARFEVQVENTGQLSGSGFDKVSFLFSANPGSAPQDIRKIASGGEMSRLMLALKSVIAKLRNLPTLIFDEIDTGISGKTADLAGEMMRELSEDAQIIAITHLPQIASKGKAHFRVVKQIKKDSARTEIVELSHDERIEELARMLSGDVLLPEAVNNAKALLGIRE